MSETISFDQSRHTDQHLAWQKARFDKEQMDAQSEQATLDRVKNAKPLDIDAVMNGFTARNTERQTYLKGEVEGEAQRRGIDSLEIDDYDARDEIYEAICAQTDAGRQLIETMEDETNSNFAGKMLKEWREFPDDNRGDFPSYVKGEMIKARESMAEGRDLGRLDEVSRAADWAGKHYDYSLRRHFDSQPLPDETGGAVLDQAQLEQAKLVHQNSSIRG